MKAIHKQKVTPQTERIGTKWFQGRMGIAAAIFIVVLISSGIVLSLVLIEDDDDKNATATKIHASDPDHGQGHKVVDHDQGHTVVGSLNPVPASGVPASGGSITIQLPVYEQLSHPFMDGFQVFYDEQTNDKCPLQGGSGLTALFDHHECQFTCNVVQDCIGYNFNEITKMCVFFGRGCLDHIGPVVLEGTVAYLKN